MPLEVRVERGDIDSWEDQAIVVNLFQGTKRPGGATGAVDKALGGAISEMVAGGDITGKFKEVTLFRTFGKIPAERAVVAGLGKRKDFTLDRVREVSAKVLKHLRKKNVRTFTTIAHGAGVGGLNPEEAASAVAEGAILGGYRFDRKTEGIDDRGEVDRVTILERERGKAAAFRKAVGRAAIVCEATNLARTLINLPAAEKTPTYLAKVAKDIGRKAGVKVTVIDDKEARKMGMGAYLGVAAGSEQPPKFIVMEYRGAKRGRPVAIVGKGITFDSGGLNIKTYEFMKTMKEDVSGAAAVIATMQAIGQLKPKVNVLAVAPCTENMPGGRAQKPGDIVTAYNKKTIEILNTDAEGRLILADALSYASERDPQAVVDLATLTGACAVGLGKKVAGLMGTDERLQRRLQNAAVATGDRVWPLPLYEEYEEQVKSDVADVKNIGGRYGGAITAALLLKKFVDGRPWVHMDIAGPAFNEGGADSNKKEYNPKGATGFGVRILVRMLEDWNKKVA
jgi:leucyl aminopeptidase